MLVLIYGHYLFLNKLFPVLNCDISVNITFRIVVDKKLFHDCENQF